MSEFPGQSSMRDPLKTARHWGPSRTGVQHWWVQRLTAAALIPLTLWFLFFVAGLVHADYDAVLASIGQPVHAFALIVLTVCSYWHGMLGLEVIIGDYVHARGREVALQIALRFGALLGALATTLAVLAVWFTRLH